MALDVRRKSLIACAHRIAEFSPSSHHQLEMPSEEVIKMLEPEEIATLARGVSSILDKLASTNQCAAAEIEWGRKTLSFLKAKENDEARAVICRVLKVPLQSIRSLEKVSQLEALVLAAYPELIAVGEVPAVSYIRSPTKKTIIRRQLHLLEKGRDDI